MFKNLDKQIIILTITIVVIGMAFQYSVFYQKDISPMHNPAVKQLIWILFGLGAAAFVLKTGYRKIITASYFLYGAMLFLLAGVFLFGRQRFGAQRWIQLGAFNLQPSEFMKLILILTLAYFLGSRNNETSTIKNFTASCLLTAAPAFLILKQPDLGTALTLFPILLVMLYIFGTKTKYITGFLLAGAGLMPFFWNFLKPYQKQRLLVFVNPNMDPLGAGYTIIQSKIAVGSGRIFGKGWLSGTQNYLDFLPERHTDFIFSVIAEGWGFLGAAFLLLLYSLLINRMLKVLNSTENIYGRLLVTGVITMIFFQIVLNIGMTIGLFPVVGITLPLISYGGSSLLTTLVGIAIVLSVHQWR